MWSISQIKWLSIFFFRFVFNFKSFVWNLRGMKKILESFQWIILTKITFNNSLSLFPQYKSIWKVFEVVSFEILMNEKRMLQSEVFIFFNFYQIFLRWMKIVSQKYFRRFPSKCVGFWAEICNKFYREKERENVKKWIKELH